MTPRSRAEVVQLLVAVLGPFIGSTMVRASANGHWDKLGIGTSLDDRGRDRLLQALRPGLNVFVGPRKAEALVAEILASLERGP